MVMLEDSPGRVDAVRRSLDGADLELLLFRTAWAFVDWLPQAEDVVLITLDHHLGPPSAGSGQHAADALAQVAPFAPVILHSSDSVGARNMQAVLDAAGWRTERFIFREHAWEEAFRRLVSS